MAFRPPNAADLQELGKKLEFNLDAEQAERLLAFMGPFSASCEILDNEPDTIPALKYPERTHFFPEAAENNYGAWKEAAAASDRSTAGDGDVVV